MFNRYGVIFLLLAWVCPTAFADADNIRLLQHIADGSHRSETNQQRNHARHPAQTLDFFGITEDMSVTELWPVKGWYTEILGPYLKNNGQLTIANFRAVVNTQANKDNDIDNKKAHYYAKLGQKLASRINQQSTVFGSVLEVPFDPQQDKSIGAAESQDMVLAFRNIHNWNASGSFRNVVQAAFDATKPGGILGIVEHKANQLSDISSSAVEGYTDESYVIEVIESVGYKLIGRSGINANPQDTKNYPKGVYALPPTLAMGDVDREKYQAIGESDRMTLKFIKPL